MKKFLKKHFSKIITAVLAVNLITLLDWDWSHFKSFATGAVIALSVGVEVLKAGDNNA